MHQTTHRTITFNLRIATAHTGRKKPGASWLPLAEIKQHPLANPQFKVLAMIASSTLWA